MKTLRRTIIIRESDLFKIMGQTIRKDLYDSIDIEPMTYSGIQAENVMSALRNEKVPAYRTLPDLYEQMLWREQSLYDKRYLDWNFTMDYPAGQIYVQSRINTAREPLHRVTLERNCN
jgi:hypothetical protein